MNIVRANIFGFCFGVRRAVNMIETDLAEHGPLCTLGAIVHNTHVVNGLARKGAHLVSTLDDVSEGGTVAITAHGAGEEVHAESQQRRLRLVDTTCPIVRRAQETAAKLVDDGFYVVLYGDADHPEVKGILSWTRGCGAATVSPDVEVPGGTKGIGIIAQTTKKPELFAEFAQALTRRFAGKTPEIRIVNTTCPETGRRYDAAKHLATEGDALIVVGSRSSANTRKLAETCRATGIPTYHIESADELQEITEEAFERIGVTAGASTPDDVIAEVVEQLELSTTPRTEGGKADRQDRADDIS